MRTSCDEHPQHESTRPLSLECAMRVVECQQSDSAAPATSSPKIEKLVEEIASLSLLEAAELTEALQVDLPQHACAA